MMTDLYKIVLLTAFIIKNHCTKIEMNYKARRQPHIADKDYSNITNILLSMTLNCI